MTDVHSMSDTDLNEVLATALGWTKDFKWKDVDGDGHIGWRHVGDSREWFHEFAPFKFATDGNAMLSLIEAMRERGMGVRMSGFPPQPWVVRFESAEGMHVTTHGAAAHLGLPRAVAEAALAALQSEGEK